MAAAVTCIRLQFSSDGKLSSDVIAWFSSGLFSHVDCVLDGGDLLGARSDRVGGKPPGVQIRPPEYVDFARRAVMDVPCTEQEKAAFHAFLISQIDKPYDYEAIAAFFFDRNWREDDSWICSELQSRAGEVSGIFPKLFLATNKITPVACALAFSAVGGLVGGVTT